ncbi:MAG: malto-oligosyltrehalose synthase [Desulfobacterales bacterium]|nr:MAG: malto-oligosyltrehalose synthase [Desulfobacterales bacterium]
MNIPTATYRIQFNPGFGFKDAARIVGYLADLGITHLYASPIFKARKDSTHGYDGVDPNRLNPQLGASAEFDKLIQAIRRHAMGWLQDVVPNHMAFDYDNRMLRDVLENGPHSKYYRFFDIEWHHHDPGLRGRLLAPFLGKHYAECLVNGEIKLSYAEAGFAVVYYDLKLPLRIESYSRLLGHGIEKVRESLGADQPDYVCLVDILDILESLALQVDPAGRNDQIRTLKQTLWNTYCDNTAIKQFIDDNLRLFNGQPGNADSFILLDDILSHQLFRLCYWKVACDEINYRRFFSINELIALCQEREEVFGHTHSLLTELIENGVVSGIRIDHIDGLADPRGFLNRFRSRFKDVYILVEKILDPAEKLPVDWPVQGTTGYEFANLLNALFVRQENEQNITTIHSRFCGREDSFEGIVYSGKRRILETQMSGDLDNLAGQVKAIADRTLSGRDFTLKRLKEALSEMLVRFPVYRTYIDHEGPREPDRRYMRAAVGSAVMHRPHLQPELLFLQRLLLGEIGEELVDDHPAARERGRRIVTRFQQLTAPLMAKGFEDTALYVYNRMLSLNDVGGAPHQFGCSAADFHDFVEKRASRWPHSMNATATHDSKRGEDVRARLNVLSEIPAEWAANLVQWHAINRAKKVRLNGQEMPDKNEEYFLYQTLVGAFPFGSSNPSNFIDRISQYMVKAAREAKMNTSWLNPNETHEAALTSFVEKILRPPDGQDFLDAFLPFGKKIAGYGIFNSLSQTLIKITAPGVPDFYQGAELLDLNVVDPDNRRPVDYTERMQFLKEIQELAGTDIRSLIDGLLANRLDGRLKLYLMAAALNARHAHPRLYREGTYIALQPAGRFHNNVLAFARHYGHKWSITAAPRFLTALVNEDEHPLGPGIWQDTVIGLPDGAPARWKNLFTGDDLTAENSLALGDALAVFPAALLIGE